MGIFLFATGVAIIIILSTIVITYCFVFLLTTDGIIPKVILTILAIIIAIALIVIGLRLGV